LKAEMPLKGWIPAIAFSRNKDIGRIGHPRNLRNNNTGVFDG
jgi:hypothetical protein